MMLFTLPLAAMALSIPVSAETIEEQLDSVISSTQTEDGMTIRQVVSKSETTIRHMTMVVGKSQTCHTVYRKEKGQSFKVVERRSCSIDLDNTTYDELCDGVTPDNLSYKLKTVTTPAGNVQDTKIDFTYLQDGEALVHGELSSKTGLKIDFSICSS